VKSRTRDGGFVNGDADRLRAACAGEPPSKSTSNGVALAPAGKLRFAERWSLEVDELDATSTFFCGDRLIIATPRRAVAVSREDGSVLWVREGFGGSTHMAGTTLVRLSPAGDVELCGVGDGEPFATTRISGGFGATFRAVHVSGPSIPPVVILPDGPSRFVAVDLRNGEHRFGYAARGAGPIRLKRAGRLLLVSSGDGSIDAIDVASSDVVWRFQERVRFCHEPAVVGESVIAVAGEPGGQRGLLFGIDLYSGELRHQRELPAAPSAPPIAGGKNAILAIGGRRRGSVACVDAENGELRWMAPDPGIGGGGAALVIDRALVVNAPAGRLAALDLEDGSVRWSRVLSDPVADDVPRRLEPVVRGGALFVPAASVHVLRPTDGASLGAALPCTLVPDLVRVDERGWIYVGEESGQLSAYAPVPHLSLVK
jgi:outer membrane protein assembly factor BamB